MGVLDAIKQKADQIDKSINPFRKAADALDAAAAPKQEGSQPGGKPLEPIETKKVDDTIKIQPVK